MWEYIHLKAPLAMENSTPEQVHLKAPVVMEKSELQQIHLAVFVSAGKAIPEYLKASVAVKENTT